MYIAHIEEHIEQLIIRFRKNKFKFLSTVIYFTLKQFSIYLFGIEYKL